MTIGTWNVNGIRARQSQVQEWVERDRPDIVCLQEIKAGSDQVPTALCEMEDYWCYWHGAEGLFGRRPARQQGAVAPTVRPSPTRAFDYESRIVTTEIAGRDDCVGLRAERRQGLRREDAVPRGARRSSSCEAHAAGKRLVICGDINIARADIDVHPKERKPRAIGQLPEERAMLERLLERGLVDTGRALDPANDQMFTWWAPWRNMRQRNIGWRLDYVLASQSVSSIAWRAAACTATSARAITRPVVASFDV